VFIPLLAAGFAFSFSPIFRRVWEWVLVAITIVTIAVWVFYASNIFTLPAEYGYVGVILITAFTYTLLRLRFSLVVLVTVVGIAAYMPYAFTALYVVDVSRVLAATYLVSFGALGGFAAYWMERSARQLFVRERQLDRERLRSDVLLLNILPQAVVDQLKAGPGERVAEAFDEVSVVFIDAVGSTEQAARSSPEEYAAALDALFRRFDEIADRRGLEKIKTIGDAYMAVAGAPVPVDQPSEAAVGMALDILAGAGAVLWPSGEPIKVRVGIATGPAMAGVIGERKFAYDLWGDTVNLASRLEEQAEPGQALVSERAATDVMDRYRFGPVQTLLIKGKGPTSVRALVGADGSPPDDEPSLGEPS
jgi:class 3 adenylate cyclase